MIRNSGARVVLEWPVTFNEHLSGSKVTEFDDMRVGVKQQVLRLDVAMADAQLVDVRQRTCCCSPQEARMERQ